MLSFKGEIRPLPYALAAFALFFSQHVAILAAFGTTDHLPLDLGFYVVPLHALKGVFQASVLRIVATFVYLLVAAWALAALSFRRAANAGVSGWISASAIAPAIQVPVIVFLCVVPPRTSAAATPTTGSDAASPSFWAAAAQGFIVSIALTLLFVALGALAFGSYRYGMFRGSPFIIGAVTAYIANRKRDLGTERTMLVVLMGTAIGGAALLARPPEGGVSIRLAAPL